MVVDNFGRGSDLILFKKKNKKYYLHWLQVMIFKFVSYSGSDLTKIFIIMIMILWQVHFL